MTRYENYDVVLVPFPFSNQLSSKKRPAVVISSNEYNQISQDIVIIAVTSQTSKAYNIGEFLLEDWRFAGLLKPSAVKSAVSTIEQSLVIKKLGKLSPNDIISLTNSLKVFLNINL